MLVLGYFEQVSVRALTIEVYNVVPDTLGNRPAAVARDISAVLLGLVDAELQDTEQRNGHNREDDSKAAKAPSPADIVIESLRRLGAGESSNDVRRGSEGVRQPSILQLRDIGRNDIYCECHSTKPYAIEHLGENFYQRLLVNIASNENADPIKNLLHMQHRKLEDCGSPPS